MFSTTTPHKNTRLVVEGAEVEGAGQSSPPERGTTLRGEELRAMPNRELTPEDTQ
jgi:hypothetical protein